MATPGAQAQREATVNEAFARIDALIAPSIAGEAVAPAAQPADGEAWIVGANPQGEWAGHEGDLAFFAGGAWLFVSPQPGMTVYDSSIAVVRRWIDGWQTLALPDVPAGGTVVDSEARAAIEALIAALRAMGCGT